MNRPAQPLEDWNERNRLLGGLLARCALRDSAAFSEVYRLTSASLLGVILRIQSQRAVAEEVLQEVFVSVWNHAGGFDAARAQPMTWLTAIARNRAIDSLRRAQAQVSTVSTSTLATDSGESEEDALANIPDAEADVLEWLGRASDARALKACMDTLGGLQRQSLALAFYCGLTHSELAEQMRQPLGTVKSWVRRGLANLKTCLDRAVVHEAPTRF